MKKIFLIIALLFSVVITSQQQTSVYKWNAAITYNINDLVSVDGVIYKATTSNTNDTPPSVNWEESGGGATTLSELTDTPASYDGLQYYVLRTNFSGTGTQWSSDYAQLGLTNLFTAGRQTFTNTIAIREVFDDTTGKLEFRNTFGDAVRASLSFEDSGLYLSNFDTGEDLFLSGGVGGEVRTVNDPVTGDGIMNRDYADLRYEPLGGGGAEVDPIYAADSARIAKTNVRNFFTEPQVTRDSIIITTNTSLDHIAGLYFQKTSTGNDDQPVNVMARIEATDGVLGELLIKNTNPSAPDIDIQASETGGNIGLQASDVITITGNNQTNINAITGDVSIQSLLAKTNLIGDVRSDQTIAEINAADVKHITTKEWVETKFTSETAIGRYDEGNGFGFYPVGKDRTDAGNIGLNAMDLQNNTSAIALTGALGSNAFTIGQDNIASQFSSVAFGQNNTASNSNTFVTGYGSTATGWGATAFGYLVNSTGTASFTQGYLNDVSGYAASGFGLRSVVIGDYALSAGVLNNSSTYGTVALGVGNQTSTATTEAGQVLVGKAAKGKDGLAFGVGNGSVDLTGGDPLAWSVTTRSNALEVYRDGHVYFPSLSDAEIDAAADSVAVTKGWVQSNGIAPNLNDHFSIATDYTTLLADQDRKGIITGGNITLDDATGPITAEYQLNLLNSKGTDVTFTLGAGQTTKQYGAGAIPNLVDDQYAYLELIADNVWSVIIGGLSGGGSGDMLKSVYDNSGTDGIVDDAEDSQLLNGFSNYGRLSTAQTWTADQTFSSLLFDNGASLGDDITNFSLNAASNQNVLIATSGTGLINFSVFGGIAGYFDLGGNFNANQGVNITGDLEVDTDPSQDSEVGNRGYNDLRYAPIGGGGGDVSKVGTPVNNELGVWTGDGTLEGESELTYNGGSLGILPASGAAMLNLNPDLGQGTISVLQTGDYDMKFELLGTGDYSFFAGAAERLNISEIGVLNINQAYSLPNVDGTIGQHLETNGSGVVTWEDAGGGLANVVEDLTPELGGDLDAKNKDINNVFELEFNSTSTPNDGVPLGIAYYNFATAQRWSLQGDTDKVDLTHVTEVNLGATNTTDPEVHVTEDSVDIVNVTFSDGADPTVDFGGSAIYGAGYLNTNELVTGTLAESKANTVVFATAAISDITLTIPDTWTQKSGAQITIVNVSNYIVTIDVSGTATLNGSGTNTVILGASDNTGNEAVQFIQSSDGSDDWYTVGKY